MMKITHTEDVDELRRAAYPPLEDFADAWFHMQRGELMKMDNYLASCSTVKNKFPKKIGVTCDDAFCADNGEHL